MKYLMPLLLSATMAINAQDTLTVQGFNFSSNTRDSVIAFPNDDHNTYERILMYYTMRCKDGLISTGSDRNRGCGEWDYSCNTSIIDSSIIDSILLSHPSVVIPGWTVDADFTYVTNPTYSYYQRALIETQISNISNENIVTTGSEPNIATELFGDKLHNKYLMWVSREELTTLNNTLNALRLSDIQNADGIDYLTIRIASTAELGFSYPLFLASNPTVVFQNQVSATDLEVGLLPFFDAFHIPMGENLMIEIAFSNKSKISTTTNTNTLTENTASLTQDGRDHYLKLSNNTIHVNATDLNSIQDEITVAFWALGDASLPQNTSIIHGEDSAGNRQLNVHLPWSNGRVYWDCGNNNGYDRIDKEAPSSSYKGGWNHWAFTKNTNTGQMVIYLNGAVWHTGSGKSKSIDLKSIVIGSSNNGSNPYLGNIDDVVIFNSALNETDIIKIMHEKIQSDDPHYSSLVLHYDFDHIIDERIPDLSPNGFHAAMNGKPLTKAFTGQEMFKDFVAQHSRLNIELISANYTKNNSSTIILDSIENFPYIIQPYSVVGTDLIKEPTLCYWRSGYMPIYDIEGNQVDSIFIEEEDYLYPEELEYYRKSPAKFELLSFVTPYGIGLDFGLEGKTWIFDVTDFGPILKGNKRLVMDRGGQWQEDMDIQFKFIKGTPARNVRSIQQIWPVDAVAYQNITNNNRFEPRKISVEPDLGGAKLRVAITGHGQEGEFISRRHWVNVNSKTYDWNVWKECGFNPIYPQGGTWVYDRAGWCPGAPTDLREIEILDDIKGVNPSRIDYNMLNASGDSRYIVNAQLVKYGPLNFEREVSIQQIKSPSSYVEYERINPSCTKPTIIIQNNGSETINTIDITYGVEGTSPNTFVYTGDIEPLESVEVVLPSFAEGRWQKSNTFYATVSNPNGMEDQYPNNNTMKSTYQLAPHLQGDISISITTNGAPQETKWYLRDENDQVVYSKTSGIAAYTNYTETLTDLDGCYTLQVTDSDQDGISWWANNDGSGRIRIRGGNSAWTTLQSDFGGEISYSFTAGIITNTTEVENSDAGILVYPNPSLGIFSLEFEGHSHASIQIFNNLGQLVDAYDRQNLNVSFDEVKIDISSQMPGIYYAVVHSDLGSTVERIVKY